MYIHIKRMLFISILIYYVKVDFLTFLNKIILKKEKLKTENEKIKIRRAV